MPSPGRALVKRWGGRAVGLVIAGVGLYVVMPSLLTMFGSWPELDRVAVHWFFILAVLELASFAALWWLARIALGHRGSPSTSVPAADAHRESAATSALDASESARPDEARTEPPTLSWGTAAAAQLAGNAVSKIVPGGAATGSIAQAKVLISAGQPSSAVASGLTAVNLLSTAVLLLLPILTIPTLLIGPPPARQLQLGLLVSLILAAVIVAVGVTVLTWPRVLATTGRGIGRVMHLVKSSVTPDSLSRDLLVQRERIATAFQGRWWAAVFAAAANRMCDYAALDAALVAFGAHVRPAEVLLAYVVALALAIVPITPGGVGFVDAGLTALLVLVGVPTDTAVIATLLYRLFSFWLPIPLGLLAWGWWRAVHRV